MSLVDINHYIGGDVSISSTGDLQGCDGLLRSQQRVLRRLLTNPGDYLFQLNYGAGIQKYIGNNTKAGEIETLIQSQIALEDCVAQTPAPQVIVSPINGGITGGVYIQIQYKDASTGEQVSLNFNVTN
jgi:hypothetical protein